MSSQTELTEAIRLYEVNRDTELVIHGKFCNVKQKFIAINMLTYDRHYLIVCYSQKLMIGGSAFWIVYVHNDIFVSVTKTILKSNECDNIAGCGEKLVFSFNILVDCSTMKLRFCIFPGGFKEKWINFKT